MLDRNGGFPPTVHPNLLPDVVDKLQCIDSRFWAFNVLKNAAESQNPDRWSRMLTSQVVEKLGSLLLVSGECSRSNDILQLLVSIFKRARETSLELCMEAAGWLFPAEGARILEDLEDSMCRCNHPRLHALEVLMDPSSHWDPAFIPPLAKCFDDDWDEIRSLDSDNDSISLPYNPKHVEWVDESDGYDEEEADLYDLSPLERHTRSIVIDVEDANDSHDDD